jgi:hypothetical protein
MKVRSRRSPFAAEPEPRVRVLHAASVQMRSRFRGLPASILERSLKEVDPARRTNPAAMSYQGDPSPSGGGAGGGAGGGGASQGGAGSGGSPDTFLL